MRGDPTEQWRVEFDAEVFFGNDGGLQTQGFRLDIPEQGIEDAELAELFIGHLGLLMVDRVVITRKVLLREPHKGSRRIPAPATAPGAEHKARRPVIAISGPATRCRAHASPTPMSLVDLPGVVIRTSGSASATIERTTLVPIDVEDRAVVLDTGGRARLAEDAADWLIAHKPALVAFDTADVGRAGKALHDAGVPLLVAVKHAELLPPRGFRLHVAPLPAAADDADQASTELAKSWPACVYAIVDGSREN